MLCQMLWHLLCHWLWQMESHCGRCCNHLIGWMADVTAKVADGIATVRNGRCYCHFGRWNSHIEWNVLIYADVIAFVAECIATGSTVYSILFSIFYSFILFGFVYIFIYIILFYLLKCWTELHPICQANSICLYFWLGMDCWPSYIYILTFYQPHEVLVLTPYYTEILECSSTIIN